MVPYVKGMFRCPPTMVLAVPRNIVIGFPVASSTSF